MDTEARRQVPALIRELLENPAEFTFFQAVRILSSHAGTNDPASRGALVDRMIRFRPKLSLDFPPTDLEQVERDGNDPEGYRVTATFLGLYGTSSPLPAFYTEELFSDAASDITITREFLDLVNTILYRLFFSTVTRYRIPYKIVEEHDLIMLGRLHALQGFGTPESHRIRSGCGVGLRHMGLFSHIPRSAAALRCLIADTAGTRAVDIEQCVHSCSLIPEDQRCRVGMSNFRLGADACLGSRIADRAGSFRVSIGPLDASEYRKLAPGSNLASLIARQIGLYLDQPLEWDLDFLVDASTIPGVVLGGSAWNRIGIDAWCGIASSTGAARRLRFRARHLDPQRIDNPVAEAS